RRVGTLLHTNAVWLPEGMNRFARYFAAHGLFAAYAQRPAIEQALAGIGVRLPHPNPPAQARPVLWALPPRLRAAVSAFFSGLDAAFSEFFPGLVAFARQRREALATNVDGQL